MTQTHDTWHRHDDRGPHDRMAWDNPRHMTHGTIREYMIWPMTHATWPIWTHDTWWPPCDDIWHDPHDHDAYDHMTMMHDPRCDTPDMTCDHDHDTWPMHYDTLCWHMMIWSYVTWHMTHEIFMATWIGTWMPWHMDDPAYVYDTWTNDSDDMARDIRYDMADAVNTVWHMTHDTWHMTHDTWQLTHDRRWLRTHDTDTDLHMTMTLFIQKRLHCTFTYTRTDIYGADTTWWHYPMT
jgi:hypothetical protein